MIKSAFLILFSLGLCSRAIHAQPLPEERCGSMLALQMAVERDPSFLEKQAEIEAFTEKFVQDQAFEMAERSVSTIPVVVHVVYQTTDENISEEQIRSQIDVLNFDFRKQNADFSKTPAEFAPFGADAEIEFCLATTSPAGLPTTGITRTQTSVAGIGFATAANGDYKVKHSVYGGADAWPTTQYLNIWVARISGSVLGFATFPGMEPASEQGIVIDPRYFGTKGLAATAVPHHLGRTCTHEAGHFFNLKHIWGELGTTCLDDDDVADTPLAKGPNYDCPTHPLTSCNNHAMFQNFMDYTDDPCMTLFTAGQKARMQAALAGPRASLKSSLGCSLVDAAEPKPNDKLRCWPNPTRGLVFFENMDEKSGNLEIFDSTGRLVGIRQATNNSFIELSGLPDGLYFLRIDGLSKKIFKKSDR